MRIAATADLHYAAQRSTTLKEQLAPVRDEADVLVVAGDLTNFGQPAEMEPLVNVLVRLRIPIVVVLGNHDSQRRHPLFEQRLKLGVQEGQQRPPGFHQRHLGSERGEQSVCLVL